MLKHIAGNSDQGACNVALDELDFSVVNELTNEFASVRANRVARNAVTALNVVEASVDRRQARNYQDTFGVSLKTAKTVTGQRHSGRCWMFSTLNVLRSKVLENLDIDDFEFSQNYIQFYDKLERAATPVWSTSSTRRTCPGTTARSPSLCSRPSRTAASSSSAATS